MLNLFFFFKFKINNYFEETSSRHVIHLNNNPIDSCDAQGKSETGGRKFPKGNNN